MKVHRFISYAIQRVFKPANAIIKVYVKGIIHPLYVRNVPSDTQIFTQIFLRRELDITLEKDPETIIDGGANIGMATVFLKNRYPMAKIFSIEPDESNFEMLLLNTSKFNDIKCYKNGLWDKNISLMIINQNAGNESFVVKETTQINSNTINAITIDEIIQQNSLKQIDLLKIDIEGSEARVFGYNYNSWLSMTTNILVEIHNWIDKDAELNVLNAIADDFTKEMIGEYHFFKRIIQN